MDTLRSAIAAYRNGQLLRGAKLRSYDIFYRYILGDILEINGQLMELSGHWPRPRSHLPSVWHEEPAFSTFIENVETGMTIADLGAGSGWFTLNACDRVGPTGSVTAFEADQARVQNLKSNIQRNGYSNVRIIQTRLDEDTSVDDYCDEVDFAIIDVEGAELAALKGLPGVQDESHSLQVLCEVHPSIITDETLNELYDCFYAYGFEIDCAPLGGSFEYDPDEVQNELHQVYARR